MSVPTTEVGSTATGDPYAVAEVTITHGTDYEGWFLVDQLNTELEEH